MFQGVVPGTSMGLKCIHSFGGVAGSGWPDKAKTFWSLWMICGARKLRWGRSWLTWPGLRRTRSTSPQSQLTWPPELLGLIYSRIWLVVCSIYPSMTDGLVSWPLSWDQQPGEAQQQGDCAQGHGWDDWGQEGLWWLACLSTVEANHQRA